MWVLRSPRTLGREGPLEEGMATHSMGILSWSIPWTEEPTAHLVSKSQTRLKQLSMHTQDRKGVTKAYSGPVDFRKHSVLLA